MLIQQFACSSLEARYINETDAVPDVVAVPKCKPWEEWITDLHCSVSFNLAGIGNGCLLIRIFVHEVW